jgi:hypothetical protein
VSPKWDTWKLDTRIERYLTGPELDAITSSLRERLVAEAKENGWGHYQPKRSWGGKEKKDPEDCFIPLGILVKNRRDVEIYFMDKKSVVPPQNKLATLNVDHPEIGRCDVEWKRNQKREVEYELSHYCHIGFEYFQPEKEVDKNDIFWSDRNRWAVHLTIPFEDGMTIFYNESKMYREAANESCKLDHIVSKVGWCAEKLMQEALKEHAHKEFMAEYNDEELWEMENGEKDFETPYPHYIRRCAAHVIETGVDVSGMTFGELIKRAKILGVGQPKKDDGDLDLLLILLNEVIVIEPDTEEEQSDKFC